MSSLDPLALWSAMAAVAAITSAIQASATFTLSSRVDDLEDRTTRSGTQERRQLKDDARRAGWRLGTLNAASVALSAGVVAAWGNVTFDRVPQSWIFVVPWITVCGATTLLAVFGVVSLGIRSYKLATKPA